MTPTEKHRHNAKDALAGVTLAFGNTHGYDDLVTAIARALAKAERESMKRAAEIALEQHKLWVGVVDSRMECGMDATVQAAAATVAEFIADAILSEIGKDE